jgi:Putative zinc-finger
MRCTQAWPLFSSYLDGAVSGVEMHKVTEHLRQCPDCKSQYGQLEATHFLISSLGRKQAPPDLAFKIRVSLSSARSRGWRERLRGRVVRLRNAFDSFMLPATAGVVTAILFFAALSGFFVPAQADPGVVQADVPTILYSPPRWLESSVYTDSQLDLDSSIVIETDVDATGRVQDYRIISGPDDAEVREQLNRALLFPWPIFAPAQSFGHPVPGKVIISFSRVHVKG